MFAVCASTAEISKCIKTKTVLKNKLLGGQWYFYMICYVDFGHFEAQRHNNVSQIYEAWVRFKVDGLLCRILCELANLKWQVTGVT